jgi:hydroxyacyl-ACP dehydratase HTD2-like protein with hotdog domain
VVHGPLNLINMLDLWRDTRAGHGEATPRSIEYRALSPVYAEEPYRAVLENLDTGAASVKLWAADGKLAMKGTINT